MVRYAIAALVAVAAVPAPALAQEGLFGGSFNFLKAVKDRDVTKAKAALDAPGTTVVNARDGTTGETALHIVARGRDGPWMRLLIEEGADINARDRTGATPLMVAVDQGYVDGVRLLLIVRAAVDLANRDGETPLIRAVNARDSQMVRLLAEAGANPDLTDNVAGKSARDYATEDRRSSMIARLLPPRAAKTAARP